jgi:hypothetical protein
LKRISFATFLAVNYTRSIFTCQSTHSTITCQNEHDEETSATGRSWVLHRYSCLAQGLQSGAGVVDFTKHQAGFAQTYGGRQLSDAFAGGASGFLPQFTAQQSFAAARAQPVRVVCVHLYFINLTCAVVQRVAVATPTVA